jgi:hypothetical protein
MVACARKAVKCRAATAPAPHPQVTGNAPCINYDEEMSYAMIGANCKSKRAMGFKPMRSSLRS